MRIIKFKAKTLRFQCIPLAISSNGEDGGGTLQLLEPPTTNAHTVY